MVPPFTASLTLLFLLYCNAVHLLQTTLRPNPQNVGLAMKSRARPVPNSALPCVPGRDSRLSRLLMYLGPGLQWLYPTGLWLYIHHTCVSQLPVTALLSSIVCLGRKMAEPPEDPWIAPVDHLAMRQLELVLGTSLHGIAYQSDYQACPGSCLSQSNLQAGVKSPLTGCICL